MSPLVLGAFVVAAAILTAGAAFILAIAYRDSLE